MISADFHVKGIRMEKQGELVMGLIFLSVWLFEEKIPWIFLNRTVKPKNSRDSKIFPKLKCKSPKCSLLFAAISIIFKSQGGKIQTKKWSVFWLAEERRLQPSDGWTVGPLQKAQRNAKHKIFFTLYCTVLRFNLISLVHILKIKTLQITVNSERNYFHGHLAGQLM